MSYVRPGTRQSPTRSLNRAKYIARNERSAIATLVSTNMTFMYVDYIGGGGQLWDQSMGMFSPQ